MTRVLACLQIWNENMLQDDLVGSCLIALPKEGDMNIALGEMVRVACTPLALILLALLHVCFRHFLA